MHVFDRDLCCENPFSEARKKKNKIKGHKKVMLKRGMTTEHFKKAHDYSKSFEVLYAQLKLCEDVASSYNFYATHLSIFFFFYYYYYYLSSIFGRKVLSYTVA